MQTQSAFCNIQYYHSGFLCKTILDVWVKNLNQSAQSPHRSPKYNLCSRLWWCQITKPQSHQAHDHNKMSLKDGWTTLNPQDKTTMDRFTTTATHPEQGYLERTPSGNHMEAAWDRHRCIRDRPDWPIQSHAIWSHNVVSVTQVQKERVIRMWSGTELTDTGGQSGCSTLRLRGEKCHSHTNNVTCSIYNLISALTEALMHCLFIPQMCMCDYKNECKRVGICEYVHQCEYLNRYVSGWMCEWLYKETERMSK